MLPGLMCDSPLQSASGLQLPPLSQTFRESFLFMLCGGLRSRGHIHSTPEKERGQHLRREMVKGGKKCADSRSSKNICIHLGNSGKDN